MTSLFVLLLSSAIPPPDSTAAKSLTEAKDITESLLGNLPMKTFVVLLFISGLGVVANLLFQLRDQMIEVRRQGDKFSWKYWAIDNILRFLLSFVLVPIFLLGSTELLGVTVTPVIAFAIGFSSDKLAIMLKKRTGFSDDSPVPPIANFPSGPTPEPVVMPGVSGPITCDTCPHVPPSDNPTI